ncbi:Transmembrane protein [Melia azedarach]|uniref:Transmembrane protein n=1 Tax=Melia azedarach TaxID=155640 RepID=A0ACC1YS26_MELAZ|nr:Transmembrane protein [Melia azedarach]
MSQMTSLLLIFSSIAIFSIAARAQDRAPHGLANEHPVTFPPSAVEFFHPKKQEPETIDPCASSKCSPLPLAAQVEATEAYESKVPTSQKSGRRLSAGGIAGIVVGSALVVLLAMGAYYVAITRRANVNRAISVQPNV